MTLEWEAAVETVAAAAAGESSLELLEALVAAATLDVPAVDATKRELPSPGGTGTSVS